MADGESGEKTEQPTGHKLTQARNKGQVPKSQEITSAFVLLTAGSAIVLLAPMGWERLVGVFRHFIWRMTEMDPNSSDLWPWLITAGREVFIILLPVALVIMITGVALNVYQLGGFLFTTEPIRFKLDKLNFITGFKKFFKLRAFIDTIKHSLKISVIIIVSYLVIKSHLKDFAVMTDMEPAAIALLTLKITAELFYKVILTLLIVSFLDYAYQKWQFMRDMRMTKQEVKDEYKQMEGDPKVKARIRQIQMEASKRRMLSSVPQADVVVTNPTHFAVALIYNASLAQAPVVLAKGQDLMAQRIKDIAREAKVPIVENKPLAQALYPAVEVGQVIPLEFYKAVAEVLSYVYRLKGKVPGGRRR
ncbi:flagellar biosynthesis protein FlhB [Deltaproteobacteria bacterium OttesenSCG-928-K17]|nr:flagellar biosynthesis protein FlhB [Deltaproteobacteria bacterium OttesenSCG-928-K17]